MILFSVQSGNARRTRAASLSLLATRYDSTSIPLRKSGLLFRATVIRCLLRFLAAFSSPTAFLMTFCAQAFILWEVKGTSNGKESEVWGISVLLIGDNKINEAAAIYQPFPGMKEALVKAA